MNNLVPRTRVVLCQVDVCIVQCKTLKELSLFRHATMTLQLCPQCTASVFIQDKQLCTVVT